MPASHFQRWSGRREVLYGNMKERNQRGHEKRNLSLIPRAREIKKFFRMQRVKKCQNRDPKSFSSWTAQNSGAWNETTSSEILMFHLNRCRLVASQETLSASEPKRSQTLIESLEKEMKWEISPQTLSDCFQINQRLHPSNTKITANWIFDSTYFPNFPSSFSSPLQWVDLNGVES